MNEIRLMRSTATDGAALPAGQLPPYLHLTPTRRLQTLRAVSPVAPPRPASASERRLLAVQRALELAAWQASGGDFLASIIQPLH